MHAPALITCIAGISAAQFITNIVFIPYLALREQPPGTPGTLKSPQEDRGQSPGLPYYAPAMGALAATVGGVSIAWALVGRSEYGSLLDRWQWFTHAFSTYRVFYAFCLDLVLYTTWQVIFLRGAERKFRFVPFAGLAAWLVAGGPRKAQ